MSIPICLVMGASNLRIAMVSDSSQKNLEIEILLEDHPWGSLFFILLKMFGSSEWHFTRLHSGETKCSEG